MHETTTNRPDERTMMDLDVLAALINELSALCLTKPVRKLGKHIPSANDLTYRAMERLQEQLAEDVLLALGDDYRAERERAAKDAGAAWHPATRYILALGAAVDLQLSQRVTSALAYAAKSHGSHPQAGEIAKAPAAKTTAELVSEAMGHDTESYTSPDGEALEDLCMEIPATPPRIEMERSFEASNTGEIVQLRYLFEDGSAIVEKNTDTHQGWDIEGPEPWTWKSDSAAL